MATPARQSLWRTERPPLQLLSASDGELLSRVANRDPAAFEALYQRYSSPVYGLALRRLRDQPAAEDAVQETFTAVWRAARSFDRERGACKSWLFAIARNAIVDSIRKRAYAALEPLEHAPEPASSDPTPHQRAEDDWLRFCTHAAVAQLPERERIPLELAYWHGLSQSEIAARLGLPLGTIKTRTRSGLARLAACLDGDL